MWRVFMCAGGTCGERRCATSEMPLAQNRPSSSAPGICRRNSGLNSPADGRDVDADLLEHPAAHDRHDAAAAARAGPRLAARTGRRQHRMAPHRHSRPRSPRTRRRSGRAGSRTNARAAARWLLVGRSSRRPPAATPVCRSASASTMAAAIATLSERRPGRSGIRTRRSARRWTRLGHAGALATQHQDVVRHRTPRDDRNAPLRCSIGPIGAAPPAALSRTRQSPYAAPSRACPP